MRCGLPASRFCAGSRRMQPQRIPPWIKTVVPAGPQYTRLKGVVRRHRLHTICTEARCPNAGECFARGTATFLVLGDVCTRACRYCAVATGTPRPPEAGEPQRLGQAAGELGLRYVVVTSVTRDDLPDGGAGHFAACIQALRDAAGCRVEPLIPDFKGKGAGALDAVIAAVPDCINHNIEVARSHYRRLRPQGDYDLSLAVLARIAAAGVPAKTGLMVGFGEEMAAIEATLRDVYATGCRMLTVGQYLRSARGNPPVARYYPPADFAAIRQMARAMGFAQVQADPLVRSSYHAAAMFAAAAER